MSRKDGDYKILGNSQPIQEGKRIGSVGIIHVEQPLYDAFAVDNCSFVTLQIDPSRMRRGREIDIATLGRTDCHGILLYSRSDQGIYTVTLIHAFSTDEGKEIALRYINTESLKHLPSNRRAVIVSSCAGTEDDEVARENRRIDLTLRLHEFVGGDGDVNVITTGSHADMERVARGTNFSNEVIFNARSNGHTVTVAIANQRIVLSNR